MLAGGQQGSTSDVPWSLIGPGWILATVSASSPNTRTPPPETMYLVDPQGGRYDLGPAPTGASLADFSGDGTHALFATANGTSETATVVGLQSGSVNSFEVTGGQYNPSVRFTNPDGQALLTDDVPAQSGLIPAQRLNLTGSVQVTFPSTFPGVAAETGGLLESPDGTKLVFSTQSGDELVSNSGQVISTIPTPAGQKYCSPVRWWSTSSILETCGIELYVQPVSGGAATPLTSKSNTETDLNAWQLPGGLLVQGAACGTTWISSVNAQGISTKLNLPGAPADGSVVGLGVEGDQLAVLMTGSCDQAPGSPQQPSSLDFYNPSANTVAPLLGNGAIGGWVDNAVMLTATGSSPNI